MNKIEKIIYFSIFFMKIKPDEYILYVKLKDGSNIKLEYKEATIWESIDFLEIISNSDFSFIEYIFNFMIEFGDRKITKEEFQDNVIIEFSEFLAQIKYTRFAGIFKNDDKKEQKEDENNEKIHKNTFNLEKIERDLAKIIAYLSPKMSIDPKEIMMKYTRTELNFWTKRYIYNENEKTEEGRKVNMAIESKEHIDDNRDFYDNEFKKLDLYLKKKEIGKKS